jgi:hypothetical protein
MVKRLGQIALVVALVSCGPSASEDPVLRTSHACAPGACDDAGISQSVDAGAGNAPLEPWPDESAGLLSGVFAVHGVVSATVVGVPLTLQVLYRLRLLQETSGSQDVMQSMTLCALKLPSVKGIATLTIPPRLTALIQEKSVVVSEGNYLSTVGGAQVYQPPPTLLVLGARLEDPATDPLPSLMNLATQWDEDMDGHPGVTVDATVLTCTGTQELYVAIRTSGTFSGTVSGFDTITGTLSFAETESVVGYSDPCLATAADIVPKLAPSTMFEATRLADEAELHTSGNMTCDDIIAAAPMLYGSVWTGE